MALDNYTNLKSALTAWCWDRSDIAAQADEFIDLCEADLNNGVTAPEGPVRLRTREMETTTTLTPSSGSATLPTDYLEWRQVTYTGSPRRNLALLVPSGVEDWFPDRLSDVPSHFAISGSTISFYPTSTTDVEFVYYAKIPALSDSNTSNWLLAKAPQCYLAGCLRHAAAWIKDYQEEQACLSRFLDQIASLNGADKGARWARAASMTSGVHP